MKFLAEWKLNSNSACKIWNQLCHRESAWSDIMAWFDQYIKHINFFSLGFTSFCSEIERQNPQTAVFDEPTGFCHSKRQRVAFCMCRQNSQCLREFSNHLQLDKKTGGKPREKEKWNVTMKLYELNSFHNNTERKKEVMSKMANLKVRKWRECALHVEYRKYRKTEAWALLGVQFVGHAFRLWWDGVCNICKFWSARTSIKEALWGGAFCCLAAELCKPVYWHGE